MNIISTHHLTKNYRDTIAVNDLTLSVEEGSIYGFLGPNGAGKTTTMKMLIGLSLPTSGGGEVAGFDIIKDSIEVRRRVGTLPDPIGFYDNLTAVQTLTFLRKLRGEGNFYSVKEALATAGLSEWADKKVGEFSRGMKQRLGIAQAIMHRPKVLLLDEPTSGLDPTGIYLINEMLRKLNKDSGVTIFLSTHLMSTVEDICDTIGIVNRGTLVTSGKLGELKNEYRVDSVLEVFRKLIPPDLRDVH